MLFCLSMLDKFFKGRSDKPTNDDTGVHIADYKRRHAEFVSRRHAQSPKEKEDDIPTPTQTSTNVIRFKTPQNTGTNQKRKSLQRPDQPTQLVNPGSTPGSRPRQPEPEDLVPQQTVYTQDMPRRGFLKGCGIGVGFLGLFAGGGGAAWYLSHPGTSFERGGAQPVEYHFYDPIVLSPEGSNSQSEVKRDITKDQTAFVYLNGQTQELFGAFHKDEDRQKWLATHTVTLGQELDRDMNGKSVTTYPSQEGQTSFLATWRTNGEDARLLGDIINANPDTKFGIIESSNPEIVRVTIAKMFQEHDLHVGSNMKQAHFLIGGPTGVNPATGEMGVPYMESTWPALSVQPSGQ
jgi:hypothetical protein